MSENITTFLGEETSQCPPDNPRVGQVIMIDGVVLEEVGHYDLKTNSILGLCQEHSGNVKTTVDTLQDAQNVVEVIRDGKCHYGKDGTVVGIAPVTDESHYYVVPLVLSPSCKADKGDELAKWLSTLLDSSKESPNGEKQHGPICTITMDGEAAF